MRVEYYHWWRSVQWWLGWYRVERVSFAQASQEYEDCGGAAVMAALYHAS